MGRIKRQFEEGYPFFITTVTYKKLPIFVSKKNCQILLIALEFFKLTLDYKIFAYCLMPDHLHLIIQATGKYDPSYIMKMIKGNFARKYNKMHSKQGEVWQAGFYDTGLRNINMLLQKIEYIHNNPVRAMIAASPDEYPFSSHTFYHTEQYCGMPGIDIYE